MKHREFLQTFTLANEFKEGDLLVGGTRDEPTRKAARGALAGLRLGEINKIAFVEDQVSETLARSLNHQLADEIAHLTVAELKQILLRADAANWAQHYRDGLSSEVIAALVKLMSNDELAAVAHKIFNPLSEERHAIGSSSHFGARLQPNSPGDDDEEILFSILEGLRYGCGDVILGLNPASDDVDTIIRLEELLQSVVERLNLPTRYCVLSDIVKQTSARAKTKVDVGFQSLAGTSKAINGMVGLNLDGLLDLAKGFDGLYFETGQGSAVTNGAAEGVDMVTLESRAYGVARFLQRQTSRWTIVNDVAGFIGPEVFQTAEQLLRACLEDTVMAKLHGLTMGLDVCATFHMGIEPAALHQLTETIVAAAAPAYLMAVAGNADPMLGYLTTSFRQHPRLRQQNHKQISTAMKTRLVTLGVMNEAGELIAGQDATAALYARYTKAGGDRRTLETLRVEGVKKIAALGERGFDLGYGDAEDFAAPVKITKRLEALYAHARRALYARLDAAVINDACASPLRVRTQATNRDDYLAHPATGEMLCDHAAQQIQTLYSTHRPQIQICISDGLNANAINENLREVLPALRRQLAENNFHAGAFDVVMDNGRVRAGYHVGALLDVEAVIHLIGERPGTGLNTLSAYLTYGRDTAGNSRWQQGVDHSQTTAICGIHPNGKAAAIAVDEIARCIKRMFEQRASGVALSQR
ncbi:MAG: ethanolamine ammonia-lyase subunit EutB [Acidobacteria bacterium]|nr:ethanolamine ammonia-lyase subunit EutB [Acidobacteriota bacterium]